jgi:hypothetical protein
MAPTRIGVAAGGALPGVVVFDLDFTLWQRPRFRGGPPFEAVGGGVRASCGALLYLYPAARRALAELAELQVPVAIASRTHRDKWARHWLGMLTVDGGGRMVDDVVNGWPVETQGPSGLRAACLGQPDGDVDAGFGEGGAGCESRTRGNVKGQSPLVLPFGRTVEDIVNGWPVVIQDGPKVGHLRRISEISGVPLREMLFFDDDLAGMQFLHVITL